MIYLKLGFLNQPSNLQVFAFTLNFDTPLVQIYTATYVLGVPLAGQIQIGINLAQTISNTKTYLETNYPSPVVEYEISGNDILITPAPTRFSTSALTSIPTVLSITEEEIIPMKTIFVRSPYFIEVDEAAQVGSKVELFIWNKGTTEPTLPTYTLSKKIPSTTQRKNVYNISSYAKQFIDIVNPTFVSAPTEEEDTNWCYVKIKRYKEVSVGSYTLLDTTTYVALNGYTNYIGGYNQSSDVDFLPLSVSSSKVDYNYSLTTSSVKPYLNFYIDYINDTDVYKVVYDDLNGSTTATDILNGEAETQYVLKVPVTEDNALFDNGNKMSVFKNDEVIFEYNVSNECEPKYSPMLCAFINRLGGWEYLTFFKARVQNWEVKNKEYQLLPSDVDYNQFKGQSKAFNFDAKQTVKINTGWVDEEYNDLIKDLMTSETILLNDIPVKLKTMTTDLKTSLQDKMINYQIDFEYNYNQINSVI
jgi:hypothetical protein